MPIKLIGCVWKTTGKNKFVLGVRSKYNPVLEKLRGKDLLIEISVIESTEEELEDPMVAVLLEEIKSSGKEGIDKSSIYLRHAKMMEYDHFEAIVATLLNKGLIGEKKDTKTRIGKRGPNPTVYHPKGE